MTTLRIGGPARWYCEPAAADEAAGAVRWALQRRVPLVVTGNGSNLLVSDAGWPGLVINTARMQSIVWEGDAARCGAGASLSLLVRQSVERGLAGAERLAGIPGTVGGAAVMNAGAFGQSFGDVLAAVTAIDLRDGSVQTRGRQELALGYRSSALQTFPCMVLEAGCRFAAGDRAALLAVHEQTLARRREKQPLDTRNCGSVFRNPAGAGAGRWIERCGLKGARVGDIEVSQKHANFFVNLGNGTAADFKRLVELVQKTVKERCGVALEPEVVFLGQFPPAEEGDAR